MIRNEKDRRAIINQLSDCKTEMQETVTEAAARLAELRIEADGYRAVLGLPKHGHVAPVVASAAP